MTDIHVFDIDGTIVKGENLSLALSKYIGREFPYKDLVHYNIGKNLYENKLIKSMDEFDNNEFFRRFEKEIFIDVELIDGFKEYLEYLEENNKSIYFLTARPMNLEQVTKNFFEEHGLQRYIPKLFMNVDGDKAKLNFVNQQFRQENVTMYEDKGETILDFYNYGHNIVQLIQPYNTYLNLKGDNHIKTPNYHNECLNLFVKGEKCL